MKCNFIYILFFFCFIINAQVKTGVIKGTIKDEVGKPILGVSIIIKGTTKGVATNFDGYFELKNMTTGHYKIIISSIGYKTQEIGVNINSNTITKNIILLEDTSKLSQVVVTGKTKATRIEEKGFTVKSIDVKKLKNTTTSAVQILNSVSGVRIRRVGGVGSDYNLSLNGLSDNQIRIFIDDIPIDELGEAYSLNNLPVNLIERIDVYKGVVPIKLGADALGGAINLITDKKKNSFLDASYSIGSFNTHKATINSKYRSKKSGFTVNLNGIYNYSDNNYTMYDIEYFDATNTEIIGDIERYHDNYKFLSGNVGIGFTDTNWTDEFLADINTSKTNNEIQGIIGGPSIGEAMEEEENTTYKLRYRSSKLLNDKLDLDIYALYNDLKSVRIDTSSNRYKWDGTFIVNPSNDGRGEFLRTKNLFKYNQKQFQHRINLTYNLNENHNVSLNSIYSDISREGENNYLTDDVIQAFQAPNTLNKIVTGIEYTSNFFDKKLENTISAKYYFFDMLAKEAIVFADGSNGIDDVETTEKNLGYAIASRYFIKPNFYIKASFEKGVRIPLPEEIFGDGLSISSNPYLQPETANNLNIGLNYSTKTKQGYLKNEINLFQRDVENYIRLNFLGLVNQYANDSEILIKGIEYDVVYQKQNLSLKANLTWQNVLNNEDFESGSVLEELFEKAQLPNTPILFGNIDVNYKVPKLIKHLNTSFYYGINYVEEFYLNYKNIATLNPDKNIIPTQLLNNAGATFSTKDKRHNINFAIQNLFNQIVFDNFNQPKPGRAFYFKYRFTIDN